jgi:predicted Rossmann fold nucleotide-binding protein DprA/Smf involved in DNA uptake
MTIRPPDKPLRYRVKAVKKTLNNNMKTIKEWLMDLPEPVRSRALKYGQELHWVNQNSLQSALGTAFTWHETEESGEYWVNVCNGDYDKAEELLDTRKQNSREAHESVNKEKVQQVILDTLFACKTLRAEGMTKDEIADHSRLKPEQVHKRMSELEKAGKVKPNGKRKGARNQTIWKLI